MTGKRAWVVFVTAVAENAAQYRRKELDRQFLDMKFRYHAHLLLEVDDNHCVCFLGNDVDPFLSSSAYYLAKGLVGAACVEGIRTHRKLITRFQNER